MQSHRTSTSWQSVQSWYKKEVGLEGSYYQREVIIPKALALLDLKPSSSIIDLACGQGVLGRHLNPKIYYQGLDIAPSLIQFARANDTAKNHHYTVGDITQKFPIEKCDFTDAISLLSLQNIEKSDLVFKNVLGHLAQGGKLIIVLNHPCFRVPKHSSWEIDEKKEIQYRRIDRYMKNLKIPIQMNPSQNQSSPLTWSFHHPLSYFSEALFSNGFHILKIEEWISNKRSTGKKARMENQSREEFPLFLTIVATQ